MSLDVRRTRDRLNAALLALDSTWGKVGMLEAVSAVCEGLAESKRVVAEVQHFDQPPPDPSFRICLSGLNTLIAWAEETLAKVEDFALREIGQRMREEGKGVPQRAF